MQIEWWTLALQAINFLVLVWLLWRFLYRPVRAVIEKRKALSEEAFAKAAAKEAEVDALKKDIEAKQAAMARERQEMLKKLHEDAAAEREKMLADSKAQSRQLIDDARAQIALDRKAALNDMQAQASRLAVDLAAVLLEKIDSQALGSAYLEKLEDQLRSMPSDELDELRKDLDGAGTRAVVVTTTPVAEKERRLWGKRFGDFLGDEGKIDFETDQGIVGGAEVRFPHATLKFTWADQLGKAAKVMQGDDSAS